MVQQLTDCAVTARSDSVKYTKTFDVGSRWWLSSQQHTRLLLRRSEFRSHSFYSVQLFKNNENKQKKLPVIAHLKNRQTLAFGYSSLQLAPFYCRMMNILPRTLPNVFEGRRGSKGGDLIRRLKQSGSVNFASSIL